MEKFNKKTEDRLTAIQQRTGMNRDAIIGELKIEADKFRNDTQLTDEASLMDYASCVLWAKYVSRMQVKDTLVIPVGFEGLRQTRTGKIMSAIYVVANEKGKVSFRRVSLPQVVKDLFRKVNILSENGAYRYTAKLGSFGNNPGSDFGADDRTIFENPEQVKLTPEKFREMFKIPVITIAEAVDNPSKKTTTGFTIRTDWRCIRGIISSDSKFKKKKSGLEGGVYRIIDHTTPTETYVTPGGKKIEATLTVWTPPELMVWERFSQCDFYGTVAVDSKTKTAVMNCCLIIPVRAEEKAEEPESEIEPGVD